MILRNKKKQISSYKRIGYKYNMEKVIKCIIYQFDSFETISLKNV